MSNNQSKCMYTLASVIKLKWIVFVECIKHFVSCVCRDGNTASVELYDTSSEVDININAMLQRLVIPDVDMAPVLPKVTAVTVSKRRTYRNVMLKIRENFSEGR